MPWCDSPWVYPVWESLSFLDVSGYFVSHVRDVFDYNLFKYFLRPFLFPFFFCDPYDFNIGVLNVIPEVSETVLNSVHSFFFILLLSSYFKPSIFQLTYLFFCLSYSVIDSFLCIFHFSYCVLHCLFLVLLSPC